MEQATDISHRKKINAQDSLQSFTQQLIERDDFNQLGGQAISVLLSIHFLTNKPDFDFQGYCPGGEQLSETTGLDIKHIEESLNTLYQRGYLNRESYWSGEENKHRYKLREQRIIVNSKGERSAEISWDQDLPSKVYGMHEFKNIIAQSALSGAKIIHIEHLQVNLNSRQDSAFSDDSGPVETSDIIIDEQATDIESQPADTHIQSSQEQNSATSTDILADVNAASEPTDSDIQPQQATQKKEQLPAESLDTESDKNGQHWTVIYQSYIDRIHQEFANALNQAEEKQQKVHKAKTRHDYKQPKAPVGLAVLVKKNRWKKKTKKWQEKQQRLHDEYQHCVDECQRLKQALLPNAKSPALYLQEARQQFCHDHPQYSSLIDKTKTAATELNQESIA